MKGYTIQHSINLLEKEVDQIGGGSGGTTAANVSYDNTSSGLTADDVQEAIDELAGNIPEYKTVVLEFPSLSITTTDPVTETIEAIDGTIISISGVCHDSGADYAIPEAGLRVYISGTSCTFAQSGGSHWEGDTYLLVTYIPTPQTSKRKKKSK